MKRRAFLVATALAAALLACQGASREGGARGGGPRAASVRVSLVERGDLVVRARFSGELFAETVEIAARTAGTLVAVPVRLGDRVAKGALLAVVDDALLRRQEDEVRASLPTIAARARRVEASLAAGRAELARKAPLARDKLVSAQELEELEARVLVLEADLEAARAEEQQAKARLAVLAEQRREARIHAPFAGVVAERRLGEGATVSPGTPILRLVEAGPLLVRFRVPERDLALVAEGAALLVRAASTGQAAFGGRLLGISGEVSRADRSVAVEGALDREDPLLRPGMFAAVELEAREVPRSLLVPSVALLARSFGGVEAQGVFVEKDGRAHWRTVRVLGRDGDRAAVDGELAEGDRVIVLGHDELLDKSPVRVVDEAGA